MVENRPGHDAQPKEDERDQPVSEATPDTDRQQSDAAAHGAQAAAPSEPELHTADSRCPKLLPRVPKPGSPTSRARASRPANRTVPVSPP